MLTTTLDLNLLRSLEALLLEGSVTGAATRAGMTVPAMSRALGRLRRLLGDELLVRAGRALVPTPRAVALKEDVHRALGAALTVLSPAPPVSLSGLSRTLVIRASDAGAALFAAPLAARARAEAPLLRLRFAPEGDESDEALREGLVDLDLGAQRLGAPELKSRRLLDDRFVAVVRRRHPLARGKLTAARLAAHGHIAVSRTGRTQGPLDAWLRAEGQERVVAAVVGSFLAALFSAASSDLVALVPSSLAAQAGRTLPITSLAVPTRLPPVPIGIAWHPRFDDDPAHRWLRLALVEVARALA